MQAEYYILCDSSKSVFCCALSYWMLSDWQMQAEALVIQYELNYCVAPFELLVLTDFILLRAVNAAAKVALEAALDAAPGTHVLARTA